MSEILFLENTDRYERFNIFWKELRNLSGAFNHDCYSMLKAFLENSNNFDKYQTIIIHQSIYTEYKNENLEGKLRDYCCNKKQLIEYTGGVSTISINEKYVEVPANRMYENIVEFTEESNPNILMIAYGKNWKTNIELNNLEKINILIEDFIFLKEHRTDLDDEDIQYIEEKIINTVSEIPALKEKGLKDLEPELLKNIQSEVLEEINGKIYD